MKFVLDACIGIKWILPEHDSAAAIALGRQFNQQIHELIAPDTFPPEVAHRQRSMPRRSPLQQVHRVARAATDRASDR